MSKNSAATTDIVVPDWSNDDLANMTDFDTALTMFAEAGITVDSIVDYGHGFSLVTDKSLLIGKPMILVEWTFNESSKFATPDGPLEFVSVYAILRDGPKVIFNDGGTGICAQLREVTERRLRAGHAKPTGGLAVPAGLTVSEYTYVDAKGVTSAASTYYLSESRAI